MDGRRFFAHHVLSLETARTFDAEVFGQQIVGFRFTEPGAAVQGEGEAVPTRTVRREPRAATGSGLSLRLPGSRHCADEGEGLQHTLILFLTYTAVTVPGSHHARRRSADNTAGDNLAID